MTPEEQKILEEKQLQRDVYERLGYKAEQNQYMDEMDGLIIEYFIRSPQGTRKTGRRYGAYARTPEEAWTFFDAGQSVYPPLTHVSNLAVAVGLLDGYNWSLHFTAPDRYECWILIDQMDIADESASTPAVAVCRAWLAIPEKWRIK